MSAFRGSVHSLVRWILAPLMVVVVWGNPMDSLAYGQASGRPRGEATQGQERTPTPLPPEQKVDPGLRSMLLAVPGQRASFLVYLSRQADLSGAYAIDDWEARGRFVFDALQRTAQESQVGILQTLQSRQATADVLAFRPYYIVNAIAITAGVSTVDALAARPDVAYIEAIKSFEVPRPITAEPIGTLGVEWSVQKIGADRAWSQLNVRGQGVVVANIDTGVLHTHTALDGQYRGATTGSHDYNWFDPAGSSTPVDNNGHGTHTMGTMIGDDGGSNQIGVAPQAKWIAAKGCATNSCSSQDLLASAEWVLAPYPIGGSPSQGDPSKRPHVVNNSWGGPGGDVWYQKSVEAWRAADIFPAFSAGNSGPGTGTVGSPGDYAESFASGATDSNDAIAYFSSRGPSKLTSETKPDVTAPGSAVRSSWNNGGYNTISGTSMSSPHTAGCVALIRSANNSLKVADIENLLTGTALDLGSTGPDNTFGYGRINCFEAVSRALNLPTPTAGSPTSTSISPSATATPTRTATAVLTRTLTPTLTPTRTATTVLTRTWTPTATTGPTSTPLPTFTRTPTTPTSPPPPGVVFFDDFETDLGWVRDPYGNDDATTGLWERADPQDTNYGGPMQLGTTVSGSYDLVTGPLAGSSVGEHDIDGGVTSIFSPEITLPYSPGLQLTFDYYLAHFDNATFDDLLLVFVVGQESMQTVLEEYGAGDVDPAAWQRASVSLDEFAGQTIYLIIQAADAGTASLVEAAIDDVLVSSADTLPTLTSTPVPEPSETAVPTATETSTPAPTATPTPLPTNTPAPGIVFFDDFEADLGWVRNRSGTDTATTGLWERADPQDTNYNGPMQLGTTVSGLFDLVTGPLAGSSVGAHDIDGGVTSIYSPDITLPNSPGLRLSFAYTLAHLDNATADDFLWVFVVGPETTQLVFEERGSPDVDAAVWEQTSVSLDAFAGQTVYLIVEAGDAGTPSLVEAAIDDVLVTTSQPAPTSTPLPPPTNTPPPATVFFDDFETDYGWLRNPYGTDTAVAGLWERADPEDTNYGGPMQLGSTVSGTNDLVTGRLAGTSVGQHDVDGGVTSVRSPAILLPSTGNIRLTFFYYLAHLNNATADDFLRVRVVWGSTSVTVFEENGAADQDDAAWAQTSVGLDAFAGQTVYLLLEAADSGTPSLLEAAIDDVSILAGGP